MKNFKAIFLTLSILMSVIYSATAQNIEITITGIRATKGQLVIGVFKDQESFKEEEPFKEQIFTKADVKNESVEVKMNLPSGVYGISVLDDEDSDGEMKYNMIGWPLEGFGFSDYYHKGMSRPVFDDFKFELKPWVTKKIEMKIRYM